MTPEQILNAFARTTVSMEENDLNINIQAEHEGEQVDEDQVPLDTSDAPETAELDVAEAIDETEEEIDGADDAVDVVESLESLLISLEAIQEQGAEFTPAAALLAQVAIDNAVSRMPGLSAEAIGIPSMEDFDCAPATSLTVSIEKIGDTIGAGLKAAGAFVKKIWEKIKAFLGRMFDAGKAGAHKAASIEKQLNDLPAGASVESGATVTVPAIVGTVLTTKPVSDARSVLSQVAKNAVNTSDVATFASVVSGDKSIDNTTRRKQMVDAFNNGLEKLNGKVYPFGGLKFATTEGGVISVTSNGGGEAKAVNVPTIQQLKDIAKENHALFNEIVDIRKQEGRHKKLNETVAKISETTVAVKNRNNNSEEGEGAKRTASMTTAATSLYNQRVSFELNLIGKLLSAGNALNNVLASAAAQYKKAAK